MTFEGTSNHVNAIASSLHLPLSVHSAASDLKYCHNCCHSCCGKNFCEKKTVLTIIVKSKPSKVTKPFH